MFNFHIDGLNKWYRYGYCFLLAIRKKKSLPRMRQKGLHTTAEMQQHENALASVCRTVQ